MEGGKQDQPDRLCGEEKMGDDGRGKDSRGGGHSELGGISLTATEDRAAGAGDGDIPQRDRQPPPSPSGPSSELL